MYAWEHFNGAFNFSANPMVPLGCRVTIHKKTSKRKSWYHRGRDRFYLGPALESYFCFKVVDSITKATSISDTVKFMHSYLTKPTLTPEDRIVHTIRLLTCALDYTPTVRAEAQLQAIVDLCNVFAKWYSGNVTPTMADPPPRVLMPDVAPPRVPNVAPLRVPAIQRKYTPTQNFAPPTPALTPMLFSEDTSQPLKTRFRVFPRENQPIAHHTRSSSQITTPPPNRRRRPCLYPLAHDRALI